MRDLNGKLARLAEFVAEGRIDVPYALDRAVVLAQDDEREVRNEMLIDIAATARERERSRCARIVGDVLEQLALPKPDDHELRLCNEAMNDLALSIMRAIRTQEPQPFDLTLVTKPVDNVNEQK